MVFRYLMTKVVMLGLLVVAGFSTTVLGAYTPEELRSPANFRVWAVVITAVKPGPIEVPEAVRDPHFEYRLMLEREGILFING